MRERILSLEEIKELLGEVIAKRLGYRAHRVKPIVDDQTGKLVSIKVEETIPMDYPTVDEMALMLSVFPVAGVKKMRLRTHCRLMDAQSWKFFLRALCGNERGDWESLRSHIDSRLASLVSK